MKLTTLACLAALCAIGPGTLAEAAPAAAPGAQAAVGRAGQPGIRASDKRRRSYAACNRASHARALQGGRRRRFLIRCKLGYERPRTPAAAQQPPLQQPLQQQAPTAAPAPAPVPAPGERKP